MNRSGAGTAAAPRSPLAVLVDVFVDLHAERVRYCHWKSTNRIPEGLAGETDLDILVGRDDAGRFRQILLRHGFKRFVSTADRHPAGTEDYLGFDEATGRLCHVHVYYRLLVGDRQLKDRRLPIEDVVLDAATDRHGVRVPPAQLELAVLVVRTLLKYRDRDVLRDLLPFGTRRGLKRSAVAELAALAAQVDRRDLTRTARDALDLPPDLVEGSLALLTARRRDGLRLRAYRRRLLRHLDDARYSPLQAVVARAREVMARSTASRRVQQLVLGSPGTGKTSSHGGLGVAIVGADGAGKSTAVRELDRWLSRRLNVRTCYMGNSGSPLVLALRKTADITFLAQAASVRVLGADAAVTRAMRAQHRSLVLVRFLAEAEGRRRRFVSSRREINQGAVVLYDRYPLGSVAMSGLGMDGPRISSIVGEQAGALERRLARREEAVYRRIWPPDHTFVLRVPADVAAARKPADRPARIASKTTALSRIVADQRSISDVDATQPRDAVLLEIKRTVWRLL